MANIKGSGGGKSGGGGVRQAVIAPNSLQSKQYANIIDLISEGEIEGLVTGDGRSVYLDGTPLISTTDNVENFADYVFETKNGTQDQTPIKGFQSLEQEVSLGLEFTQAGPIVRRIEDTEVDAIRVTVGVPALSYTNTTNGDVSATSVEIQIEVADVGAGGPFVPQEIGTIYPGTDIPESAPLSGINRVPVPYAYADLVVVWPQTSTLAAFTVYTSFTIEARLANSSNQWVVLKSYENLSRTMYSHEFYDINTQNGGYDQGYDEVRVSYRHEVGYSNEFEYRVVVTRNDVGPAPVFASTYTTSGGWNKPSRTIPGAQYFVKIAQESDTISGKTASRYQRAYLINLTGVGPWDVRVSRITPNPVNDPYLLNSTFWDSYTLIANADLRYPNSAIVGITIDSAQFNSIPSRGYLMKGLKIKIPSNYNPADRSYTGIWDGTFKVAWSDNPAWCFYDLCTNTRYGLGDFISEDQIDKAMLYQIGQYCDEDVADGFGGLEPRFTCNLYLQSREDAFRVLNNMATIFAGLVYWSAGNISFSQDAPGTAVAMFNNSNVINGMFNYQGTSRNTRHTAALISYNDPEDSYVQKVEYVEDVEGIAQFGYRPLEMASLGCTSRGQAHRLGKRILLSERYLTETVNFETGLEGAYVSPGDIITIFDADRFQVRNSGRIQSGTSTTVVLDAPIEIIFGKTYTITIYDVNTGLPETRTVTTFATPSTSTVTVGTAFTTIPEPESIWLISYDDVQGKDYRVLSISERDGAKWEISALEYDNTKYDAIDSTNLKFQPKVYGTRYNGTSNVTTVTFGESLYIIPPSLLGTKVSVSWQIPQNSPVSKYVVSWRYAGDNWNVLPSTSFNQVDILDVLEGPIEVKVKTYNFLDVFSDSEVFTYTVLGKSAPPNAPTNFTGTLVEAGVLLNWSPTPDLDLDHYEITVNAEPVVTVPKGTNSWVWNNAIPGTNTFNIVSVDTSGNLSTNVSINVDISAPPVPSMVHSFSGPNNKFVVTGGATTSNQLRTASYEIFVGPDTGNLTLIDSGLKSVFEVKAGAAGSFNYWVRSLDKFGNPSAYSAAVPVVQNIPTTPTFNAIQYTSGQILLSWEQPASDIEVVEYRIKRAGAIVARSLTKEIAITADWVGASHTFTVEALDAGGNYSLEASQIATIAAPGAVAFNPVVFSGPNVVLSWTKNKNTFEILEYVVKQGASYATANLIGNSKSTTYNVPVDWQGSSTFWVNSIDSAGNLGLEQSVVVNPTLHSAPSSFLSSFLGNNYELKWIAPTDGSLPISSYEIRSGNEWGTGLQIATLNSTLYTAPASWLGNKNFFVAAIDSAGNYGTPSTVSTLNLIAPGAVQNLQFSKKDNYIEMVWGTPLTGSLTPVDYYEIKRGGVYATAEIIDKTYSTLLSIPITWIDTTETFWVTPYDYAGNKGTSTSIGVLINRPAAPTITSSEIIAVKAQINWAAPTSDIPILDYIIRTDNPAEVGWPVINSGFVARLSSTSYRVPITWTGARTFYIAAVDLNGNIGPAVSTAVTVQLHSVPLGFTSVIGSGSDSAIFTWSPPSTSTNIPVTSLPIESYEIRYGGTAWETGDTLLGRVKSTVYEKKITEAYASRVFRVAAIDINGNRGAIATHTLTINPPVISSVSTQTLDNNVLLFWNSTPGTLPIDTFSIRKGPTYELSTDIGTKTGGFTTVFETSSGTYTYWVTAIDTAGNIGAPTSVVASVQQPPDYILTADYHTNFVGQQFLNTLNNNDKSANAIVTGNTLTSATQVDDWAKSVRGTNAYSSGKWFWEVKVGTIGTGRALIGIAKSTANIDSYPGSDVNGHGYYSLAGTRYNGGTGIAFGDTYSTGDIIGVALDADAGNLEFFKNGIKQGTTISVGIDTWYPMISIYSGDESLTVNFGENGFLYQSPSGYNGIINGQYASNGFTLPINTTETQTEHFTVNSSFATPQAQVDAGATRFIQPIYLTGSYEEVLDYGTVLPSNKISVLPDVAEFVDSPIVTNTISVKTNLVDPWTDFTNTFEVFSAGFRYVKVKYEVTNTNDRGYVRLNGIQIKLDTKLKNDAGSETLVQGGAVPNGNLVDYTNWTVGVMPPSGFGMYGTTSENAMVNFTGPSGQVEPTWQLTRNGIVNTLDGGLYYGSANIPVDSTKKSLVACFVRRTGSTDGSRGIRFDSRVTPTGGALGQVLNLAGAPTDGDIIWTSIAVDTWYLAVVLIHEEGYAGADVGVSGIYSLPSPDSSSFNIVTNKVTDGSEFKLPPGVTTSRPYVYQWNAQVDSDTNAWLSRPIFKQVSTTQEAQDLVAYIMKCTVDYGASAKLNVPFLDITSITVSSNGITPTIPMYDFLDTPNPVRFNIFNFTTAGVPTGGSVGWSVKGY